MQQFTIGKLHGRFVVTWREADKRLRYRLNATTKQTAHAEGMRVWEARQVLNGRALTFADLKDRYAAHLGDRVTGKQLADLWKKMGPALGGFLPEQIDDDIVRDFLADCQKDAIKRRGKPLSGNTLYAYANMAQNILNYGTKKRIIDFKAYLFKPMRPAPRDRWLTREEIDVLLSEMRRIPHLYTATLLMLSTAGRVSSILELTWDRVDFREGTIDLRIDPKAPAKGRAFVPMNEGLRSHLLAIRDNSECDNVVNYRDQPVASIFKAFKAHCKLAGLPDVSPHVMRHTAAVHMVASGCPMQRVSQYLGHSSISVTEKIYARFAPEHLRAEAQAVDFLNKKEAA